MHWQQFFDLIKTGQTGGVFVFQGPEEYVKRSALDKLRAKLLPSGMEALNEVTLDGADATRIIESAETLPVMCERRLLIVRDWAPLLGGKAKDEAEQAARIEAWLPRAPRSCATVFYLRGEPDKRKKAAKAMEKHAQIVEFNYLSDADLQKWISAYLKPFNKRLAPDAFDALVFLAGRSLTKLAGELGKLAAGTRDARDITLIDVRAAVAPSAETNVFLMIDALMARNARNAYGIMETMLDSGENCVGMLAMLTRQLRLMTHAKLMTRKKLAPAAIERGLNLPHFAYQRLIRQVEPLSPESLIAGYKRGVACDFAVKSGKMRDRAALDEMMLYLQSLA